MIHWPQTQVDFRGGGGGGGGGVGVEGGGEREPGTHCLRINPGNSYFSVLNVNLDPTSMPKNRLCWPWFRLGTLNCYDKSSRYKRATLIEKE